MKEIISFRNVGLGAVIGIRNKTHAKKRQECVTLVRCFRNMTECKKLGSTGKTELSKKKLMI